MSRPVYSLIILIVLLFTAQPRSRAEASDPAVAACLDQLKEALPQRPWEGAPELWDALIVSVPDPVDARQPALFDRTLEGVVSAVASDGSYLLDHHWFPWTDIEEDEKKVDDKSDKNDETASRASMAGEKKKANSDYRDKCRLLLPGVILFRNAFDADSRTTSPQTPMWRILFLIAESPVWGANEQQFLWAFEKAALGCSSSGLRFLGPYYSGAAQSTVSYLNRFRRGPSSASCVLHMASGSMSASTEIARIQNNTEKLKITPGFQTYSDGNPSRFEALRTFFEQSPESDALVGAVIREEATAYGVLSTECDRPMAAPNSSKGPWRCVPFPSDLVEVRKAYDKANRTNKHASQDARPWLQMPLSPDKPRRDLIPQLSPDTTSSAHDLTFKLVGAELEDQGLGGASIVISFTAPEDNLFAARQLRRALPGSRVVFLNLDLLYLHPDYAVDVDGALATTNYPLLAEPTAHAQRMQFSRDSATGMYFAARQLLKPVQHDDPGLKKPCTTIGVIRRGRFWQLTTGHEFNHRGDECTPLPSLSYSTPWSHATISILMLLVLAIVSRLRRANLGAGVDDARMALRRTDLAADLAFTQLTHLTLIERTSLFALGLVLNAPLLSNLPRLDLPIVGSLLGMLALALVTWTVILRRRAAPRIAAETWPSLRARALFVAPFAMTALGLTVLIGMSPTVQSATESGHTTTDISSATDDTQGKAPEVAVEDLSRVATDEMQVDTREGAARNLLLHRADAWESGVSPVVPAAFCCLSCFALAFFERRLVGWHPRTSSPNLSRNRMIKIYSAAVAACALLTLVWIVRNVPFNQLGRNGLRVFTLENTALACVVVGSGLTCYAIAIASAARLLWAGVEFRSAAISMKDRATQFRLMGQFETVKDYFAEGQIALCQDEERVRRLFPGVLITCACFGLTITEYPWHPGRLVSTAAAGFLLAVSIIGVGVYFTLERHSASNPAFFEGVAPLHVRDVLAIMAWGAFPIWLALSAYFPELTYFLVQWLKWQFKVAPDA